MATANTVTVACKLPHGLVLSVVNESGVQETHTLKGSRLPYTPDGIVINRNEVSSGYGLTPNVPADFFAKWLEQNRDMRAVKEALIFTAAKGDLNSARDQAKDLEKHTTTGLEPIDPTVKAKIDGQEVAARDEV